MYKFLAAFIVCAALSGCDGGPSAPAPIPAPPPPMPAPVALMPPRRGTRTDLGKWDTGDISFDLKNYPEPDTRPDTSQLPATATWGAWPQQVSTDWDNAPSAIKPSLGNLAYHSTGPGFSLQGRETCNRFGYISMQMRLLALPTTPPYPDDNFAGPVVYDGEYRYRALYLQKSETEGMLDLTMYGIYHTHSIAKAFCAAGEQVTLRLDYDKGVWTYGAARANDAGVILLATEKLGDWSDDRVDFDFDPHPSIFIGNMAGFIYACDVFSEA